MHDQELAALFREGRQVPVGVVQRRELTEARRQRARVRRIDCQRVERRIDRVARHHVRERVARHPAGRNFVYEHRRHRIAGARRYLAKQRQLDAA